MEGPFVNDRDEMSNLHRGHSIDASYQVSVHLAKQFQEKILKNWPIRNKNGLSWPVLSKDCPFCPDPSTNMAAIGNTFF
jgi:hypothetical protein